MTEDLQRLQAYYSNYLKRVDRDRAVAHELAVASVLNELLPILDDLDRARTHGELEGGFKSVADQIENAVSKTLTRPERELEKSWLAINMFM